MKKVDYKSIFSISLAVAVLASTVTPLCIFSSIMTNFCTAYVVIARCNDSIVIANAINKDDQQIRRVNQDSTIKSGDLVNYYLLVIKSYDSTGVKVLSDDYDAP